MRDTDRDLASVLVVRNDSPVKAPGDLQGAVVATGARDSPQATLIPLGYLADLGVRVTARNFDVGVGLHGDHIGGERDAARALANGEVDAAFMLDANHLLFVNERVLPTGTRIVGRTPQFDHCNMTVVDSAPAELVATFSSLLLGMSYADAQVRPLLDLEGLTSWQRGRTVGYAALAAAVDHLGFYGSQGEILARDYHP
jgi:ABC-type phosphate/phosphonate transport system substrate-binding protein